MKYGWMQKMLKWVGATALTVAALAPLLTTWLFTQEAECPKHLQA